VPGPRSKTSGNAAAAAAEGGEEICSQPVVPNVGMIFDDLEVAKQVYNDYAFKVGFGIRIGNTKNCQARGVPKNTLISRDFECVHSGKPADEAKNSRSKHPTDAAKGIADTVDMSSYSGQKSKSK
jgi:hypothetical protein